MKYLTKFVTVADTGEWFYSGDSFEMAQTVAERTPGLHVERWTYPMSEDGIIGTPTKERVALG